MTPFRNTEKVTVVTCDGRCIVGKLHGYDQLQNLILCDSHEKVYSVDDPVELVLLGLYIIRGDNVAIISELAENDDLEQQQLDKMHRGEPLKPISQHINK
uniref:U6 snRNA-associated Sm-like protein LSm8 n=1 Tax=Proboscia inermis TaxID=420281 RepID=A0A7S0BV72_9STRA|mmetsp:Transcript_11244/g.11338  ORF Transcript_11244/g.11338 Transcript_11244/m.11338 type:complete len:100 (+) Transcript_11244:251-550(+)